MRTHHIFIIALAGSLNIETGFGQNLLQNGNFESGSAGWTTWTGDWGSGHAWDFNNAEGGQFGTAALKLSINGEKSFGVYQEVPVTPGTAYRLDAYWTGQKFGDDTWYEIILLDGPWDPFQADSGGDVVYTNFMYGYDSNTYPLPGDFGWVWAHEQNDSPVDWMDRNGVRTATGDTMTVVLKAGCCCGTSQASAGFDEVSLLPVGSPADDCTSFVNGDFADGLNHWTAWVQHDTGGDLSVSVNGGELSVTGSNFNGGVYQQINTGGAGTVVSVIGYWRSSPTIDNALWAEVLVINADRVPIDGLDETDGANNAILLYKNDTFGGRDAWDDALPKSAPVTFRIAFTAAGDTATILLKTGNTGVGLTGAVFDNMGVHCVPPPATMNNLPPGFVGRSTTIPVAHMVCIAQNPVSKNIYAVSNEPNGAATRLYRIEVDGPTLGTSLVSGLGSMINFVQGMTFDPAGQLYLSSKTGIILKGTEVSADSYSFTQILDMPDSLLGLGSADHGVGGLAVGPDNRLYINSGSGSHYGYLANGTSEVFDGRLNARILRCNLDGSGLETFAEGVRNMFDIAFRADGQLFSVGNGPNTNCNYSEEFNRVEQGHHYGFPYEYGSDLSGGDATISCRNGPGGNVTGPPPKPDGLITSPAWANYGPDAKPGPGELGEQDGLDDLYYGFDPHRSPDGLSFYEPSNMDPVAIKFPREFHGRAFVAHFGELEQIPPVGHDVTSLRIDDVNEGFICNTFVSLASTARPIDVLCADNGKLYILEFAFGGSSPLHEIRYTIPADVPIIAVDPPAIERTVYLSDTPDNDRIIVSNSGSDILNFVVSDDADWLDLAPTGGTNSGEADLISIRYPGVAALTCGTHVATITISDPAAVNDPVTVDVTLHIRSVSPDLDCDGDVDQTDFGYFQACYSESPGALPPPNCEKAKLDGDDDVDAGDYEVFKNCMSGADVSADRACDGTLQSQADLNRGGAMYDNWWIVAGVSEPTGDHPLWALRPDPVSNTRTGSATHRCKECHGWDYKGVDGAYSSGGHRTGFGGVFGTALSARETFDLLKDGDGTTPDGHSYGALGLNDGDVWDLVHFITDGQIDTDLFVDDNRRILGNVARGATNYAGTCNFCHGANGTGLFPSGHDTLGEIGNQNPWELLHKIRFGQPGTPMPNAEGSGWNLDDVADTGAYVQTLPTGQVP